MSVLAWQILRILTDHVEHVYKGEYGRGYMAAWTLAERLGIEIGCINGVDVKIHPRNPHEAALRELIDLGIVEEMEDLHERFRLVVKG